MYFSQQDRGWRYYRRGYLLGSLILGLEWFSCSTRCTRCTVILNKAFGLLIFVTTVQNEGWCSTACLSSNRGPQSEICMGVANLQVPTQTCRALRVNPHVYSVRLSESTWFLLELKANQCYGSKSVYFISVQLNVHSSSWNISALSELLLYWPPSPL